MKSGWLTPAAAALLALCGCDQVLGIEGGTESPWFCNAHVAAPSGRTSYDFHFVNGQLKPFTPSHVFFCAKSDPTCAHAKSEPVMSNSTLPLKLEASNDGYLEVLLPLDWSTLIELGPPGNLVPTDRTFPVFNAFEIAGFQSSIGLEQDEAHGALIVAAYDCNETPAEGVSIAVTVEGRPVMSTPLYVNAGYDSVSSGASTSSSGLGVVPDIIPSDAATVTLTRASDQGVVATALVHIRAKAITIIYLGPTKTK